MDRIRFINKWCNTVTEICKSTGVLPSVTMAQMIIESADSSGVPGASSLYLYANAAFGIKADKSWTGEIYSVPTWEYIDGKRIEIDADFREYDSIEDSITDHCKFLQENSNYKEALQTTDYKIQAQALQDAGYATAPNYAQEIISICNYHKLYLMDNSTS